MNSTTNQPNLIELAKQGNAKAIATLMNRQLQPKGITAKAALKDGCLQIMLESAQVPNQQALVALVRKGITSLGAAPIERVKVYGRQTSEEFPAWSQEFELLAKSLPLSNSTAAQSATPNTVKQQKQFSLKILAGNDNFSKAIDKFTTLNLDTGLILACVIYSICLLFSDWNYGTLDELFEGFARAAFLSFFALIPATIANKKGREFQRWWCFSFLILPVALLMSVLINKNKDPQIDVFDNFRKDITQNPLKWAVILIVLLAGLGRYFDPLRQASREATKEFERINQQIDQLQRTLEP